VRALVAVVVGGLVGTGLRLGIDLLLPHGGGVFPLGTLLVNLVGALALGLVVGRVWPVSADWLRAGLGAGLLGSFTTFSALAVSVVELTAVGAGGLAIGYLAASLAGGLAAAAVGIRLGTRGRTEPSAIGPDE